MEKLNLIVIITAILLIGLALVFKMVAPTGASVATTAGASGNIVTVIAIIAIAGIVVLTLYKKFD